MPTDHRAAVLLRGCAESPGPEHLPAQPARPLPLEMPEVRSVYFLATPHPRSPELGALPTVDTDARRAACSRSATASVPLSGPRALLTSAPWSQPGQGPAGACLLSSGHHPSPIPVPAAGPREWSASPPPQPQPPGGGAQVLAVCFPSLACTGSDWKLPSQPHPAPQFPLESPWHLCNQSAR